MAYTLFISLEFALHDSLIEYFDRKTGSKGKSVINSCLKSEEKKKTEELPQTNQTHWHNEILASFLAGAIGAFLTNGIEMIGVNKQTNPSLTLKKILLGDKNQNMTQK